MDVISLFENKPDLLYSVTLELIRFLSTSDQNFLITNDKFSTDQLNDSLKKFFESKMFSFDLLVDTDAAQNFDNISEYPIVSPLIVTSLKFSKQLQTPSLDKIESYKSQLLPNCVNVSTKLLKSGKLLPIHPKILNSDISNLEEKSDVFIGIDTFYLDIITNPLNIDITLLNNKIQKYKNLYEALIKNQKQDIVDVCYNMWDNRLNYWIEKRKFNIPSDKDTFRSLDVTKFLFKAEVQSDTEIPDEISDFSIFFTEKLGIDEDISITVTDKLKQIKSDLDNKAQKEYQYKVKLGNLVTLFLNKIKTNIKDPETQNKLIEYFKDSLKRSKIQQSDYVQLNFGKTKIEPIKEFF